MAFPHWMQSSRHTASAFKQAAMPEACKADCSSAGVAPRSRCVCTMSRMALNPASSSAVWTSQTLLGGVNAELCSEAAEQEEDKTLSESLSSHATPLVATHTSNNFGFEKGGEGIRTLE